jgi:putative FmdB family regulatory protein
MPLYEYYCEPCNGIFEELRPIREASLAMPCPECFKDSQRIMPTSFAAFTFRDGYPRRIPDDGKYYHLGKKVNTLVKKGRPNEHPEINKPKPPPQLTKGEKSTIRDMQVAAAKGDLQDMYGNAVKPEEVRENYKQKKVMRPGTPKRGLK